MSQPLNDVAEARGKVVYVVTVADESRVKEQRVFASLFDADKEFRRLCAEYGGRNVALTSRAVS